MNNIGNSVKFENYYTLQKFENTYKSMFHKLSFQLVGENWVVVGGGGHCISTKLK